MQRGVPVWEAAAFLALSAEVPMGRLVDLESARERRQKA
jgi:hypothetical protein